MTKPLIIKDKVTPGSHNLKVPITNSGQCFPALRARSLVSQIMAPEGGGRRCDHRSLCGRFRGRLPISARRGEVSPRPQGSAGSVRTGTPSVQNSADRVWPVRESEPGGAPAGKAGDVRFSGYDALLRSVPERMVPCGAHACKEAGGPNPETHRGTAPTHSSSRPTGRGQMARTHHPGVAELLRRPRQLPVPETVRVAGSAPVSAGAASALPPLPIILGSRGPSGQMLLAQSHHHPPMARPAPDRQLLKVGAVCLSGPVRICAGGPGKPGSLPRYHWMLLQNSCRHQIRR